MLKYLLNSGRWLALLMLLGWGVISTLAIVNRWHDIFAAMGSFLLCLGFAVFLTDRFRYSETRRLWDHELETQMRLLWRYLQRLRHGELEQYPISIDEMEAKLGQSFEAMLTAKNREARLETYRLEMSLSILGTLQWGFGKLIVTAVHG